MRSFTLNCVIFLKLTVIVICALTPHNDNDKDNEIWSDRISTTSVLSKKKLGLALVKPKFIIYKYLLLLLKKYFLFTNACEILRNICPVPGTSPVSSTTTQTPPVVTPSPDVEYILVEQKLSWMDAHIYCKQMGKEWDLTTVENIQEFQLLQNLITQAAVPRSEYVWTSGNNLFRPGMWTWLSTGNPITTFFPTGNTVTAGLPPNQCIDLFFDPTFSQFVMAEFSCTIMSFFICKKN